MKYAEEHPEEVLEVIDNKTEALIRELERQAARLVAPMARSALWSARRVSDTRSQSADVPF